MIKNLLKPVAIGIIACVVSACSTLDGIEPSDKGITIDAKNKSYDEVWKSSVSAMSTNLAIVDIDKAQGVIKSEAPAGMGTWGEVVGLFITPTSKAERSYSIHVVSKKRSTFQITGQNWAPSVAARIKADLDVE
jgi:hypothetical protein